ncbi:PEP-CTERM sorting domain-containing protein [Aquabacterium sp. A7-Y]|uniref:PEP-CTERM sorting domain-containing protein n=1 Tax=Aquabacterium sp. A7-Y TaxID=1349605 RepID=UPI00223C9095|nr:PEP-CTERM sorting domain-containing protein [Aquabacterium sp. A7-Y]MCW7536922.1 PEP-CTERM sorting domain-containing protein [Aquabacterium sp. A7-Y]
MNLGDSENGLGPARIATNRSSIVLEGPRARLVTLWRGLELDALGGDLWNEGSLTLLGGAVLQTQKVANAGRLEVGAGSVLRSAGLYQWDEPAGRPQPSAWLSGTVEGAEIWLQGGRVSAGAEDEVGSVHLVSPSASFGAALLLDIAGADAHDRIHVSGPLGLSGSLYADFDAAPEGPGTWRFLTAEGGIGGSFASVSSNLDPGQYRVAARYGDNFVDLVVSAVPEPGSWALALAGLGLLGMRELRRRAVSPLREAIHEA